MKSAGINATAVLVGMALLCAVGCKKKAPQAVAPPAAVQKPAALPARREAKLPEPPRPETSPPGQLTPPVIAGQPESTLPPPPEPPKKPKKRRVARKANPAQNPAPAPAAPQQPPARPPVAAPDPAPKLGQLLSPEEQQIYIQGLDEELQRAKRNLALANSKTLSEQQKSVAVQVQNFIEQAEDLRKTDLIEAKGLSRKADILAADLARSLQ